MSEIMTISKNRTLPASMDFELLRREGLKHIEELASDIWTDYNVHDPGITILEALCYAITELGYRSRFDMKDLLAGDNGKLVPGQTLFTAKEILTINPLTINDYRKLLVDIEGIQNAWLIADDYKMINGETRAINEVPLFADCVNDELTTKPNDKPIFLSGLYQVLLSLDHNDAFGDLNDGDIVKGNPELANKYAADEFYFSFELPSWKNADFEFAKKAGDKTKIQSATLTEVSGGWKCSLKLSGIITPLEFGVTISKIPASGKPNNTDAQLMFDKKEWLATVFVDYHYKIREAHRVVNTAIKTVHEHRNLCEDFISITTADSEQVSFCFDTDVKPNADIEKVQAEIFYAIENYLNPPVEFYSLKELLDKKIPVDEIFNGPILKHGFIDTEQLKKTTLRKEIHTSDIINLLMDIDGVIAIRNFRMTRYGADGKPVPGFTGMQWCLPVTPLHKPVLRADKSKILLFKNEFPFLARYDEVKDSILLLHAIHAADKLTGHQDDIQIPVGKKRATESYWPVQNDFPLTYGIGEAGLPSGVSVQRAAQQQQLKAYLIFFEQLLADFFSQLSNSHKLFSTKEIKHTYYAQFLEQVNETDALYVKNGANVTIKDIIQNADSTVTERNGWQDLYEPKNVFEDRHNRFLDHLLSRFSESFNDYALMLYSINYDNQSQEKIDFTDIVTAKKLTLEKYPVISSQRGKAYNYFPQLNPPANDPTLFLPDTRQYWDTDNVSGLEKRICTLTGLGDKAEFRRFLYCINNIEIICIEKEVIVNGNTELKCFHSFKVISLNDIELVSIDFEAKKDAEKELKIFRRDGTDAVNYTINNINGKFKVSFGATLIGTNEFDAEDEAKNALKEFADELSIACNNPEGLHLIEHILLRPRTESFNRMQVCLDDCDCLCEFDPYSFRVSVVLPYWPGYFDNMAFRKHFENKIREEAPAHVMLKICWLSNDKMREFEIGYKKWIETLAADPATNVIDFKKVNDRMVDILKDLHSEYPKATLHNCVESEEGSNTVILNKTVLGTFKT